MKEKIGLFAILLVAIGVGTYVANMIDNWFISFAITGAITVAFVWVYHSLSQVGKPVKADLTAAEIKGFFTSKIFWLALLNLAAVVSDGLFGYQLDEETQTQILALDWSNITKAIISVAIMVVRKFDIMKIISGLF